MKSKQIAVMLDIEQTSEDITDEMAKIFIKQLEFILKKFSAEVGIISLSTHYNNSDKIRKVLNVLANYTTNKIKIGLSFYYGGMYDFNKKLDIKKIMGFNRYKIDTFEEFYGDNSTTEMEWFAIVDDGISEEEYKKYQNKKTCLFGRPSKNEEDLQYNSFMNVATTAKGMEGVIEIFAKYIESIKGLTKEEILEKQKNMVCHLSFPDLVNKIRNREYAYLEQYFMQGYADKADYQDTIVWLEITTEKIFPTIEEREYLNRILLFIEHFYKKTSEEQNLIRIKDLKNNLLNKQKKN